MLGVIGVEICVGVDAVLKTLKVGGYVGFAGKVKFVEDVFVDLVFFIGPVFVGVVIINSNRETWICR